MFFKKGILQESIIKKQRSAELFRHTRPLRKLFFQRVSYYCNWNLGESGEREKIYLHIISLYPPISSLVNTAYTQTLSFLISLSGNLLLKPISVFQRRCQISAALWDSNAPYKGCGDSCSLLPFPQQGYFFCGHGVMKAHCKLHFPEGPGPAATAHEVVRLGRGDALPHLWDSTSKRFPWWNLGKNCQDGSAWDFLVGATGTGLHPLCKLPLHPNCCRWKSSLFNSPFAYQMAKLSVDLRI